MSDKQLHILFLPKWYPNEYDAFDGNFIENYAVALAHQFRLSILFVHSEVKADNNYRIVNKSKEAYEEVHVYFKKADSSFAALNKITTAFRYKKAQELGLAEFSQQDFDLSHVHVLSRSSLLALSLLKQKNIPLVISEHWSGYHAHVAEYRGFFKQVFTKHVVSQAKGIHTVCTQLKQSMEMHGLQNVYCVIPNVVDTELFKPISKTKSDTIEVLFVGNLLQRPKRIFDIIKTTAQIASKRSDFRLSIYGEGHDEEVCQALIDKLGAGDYIHLKGTRSRSEIAQIMAASDFLLLFSEFENQPCVINEAQACGIPVLVPDLSGIAERMHADLGILYTANDLDGFETAYLQMLDTYEDYDQTNIRNYAIENYSEQAIAKQFTNFYQKALNR